jgi:membrane associated rhomboid family serine protease
VLPLKDENPTRRAPVLTVAILLACVGIYFAWQPSLGEGTTTITTPATEFVGVPESLAFNLERAAIPCELVQGRPLTVDEVTATYGQFSDPEACGTGSSRSPAAFPDKSVWLALLTSMFLHGGIMHLAGNMLFLWVFGNNIEDHLGRVRFLLFYLVGGVVATGAHVALNLDSTIPVVGASGAIAAVMGAYLVWFPDAPVRTVIIFFLITVIDLRAKWLLGFWFVSQFFINPNAGVAWAAHVGGFVFGVVVGLLVRASRALQRATWTQDHRDDMRSGWDNTGGAGYGWYEQGPRRLGRDR